MSDLAVSAIAVLSLIVSGVTAWLTLLHRGTVEMTKPTTIFFGPDFGAPNIPKIYFKALLYSTSRRRNIIQSMYIRVRRSETQQVFNVWVYGDTGPLVRGSGLSVGYDGVAYDHHFLLPRDQTSFEFLPGRYTIEIYATLVNRGQKQLASIDVILSAEESEAIRTEGAGVHFDLSTDDETYISHIRLHPPHPPGFGDAFPM